MFTQEQTRICREELEKAYDKYAGRIDDWLDTDIISALSCEEGMIEDLFINYYHTSLVYLDVKVPDDILAIIDRRQ